MARNRRGGRNGGRDLNAEIRGGRGGGGGGRFGREDAPVTIPPVDLDVAAINAEAARTLEGDTDGSLVWRSLGGNNEDKIGANSGLYTVKTLAADGTPQIDAVVVDFGNMPSNKSVSGYTNIMPDPTVFAASSKHADQPGPQIVPHAILLTHGHADHNGGIAPAAKEGFLTGVDVYGSPLSLAITRNYLDQYKVPKGNWPNLIEIEPGQQLQFGAMTVTAVSVSHSIPQEYGFFIETPKSRIFHTGDVKADQNVPIGPPTDFKTLEQVGQRGVDAIFMDSTRITNDGETPSETEIVKELKKAVEEAEGRRVIVAVMGTSLERMAGLAQIAAETGRTMVVEGASIMKNIVAMKAAGVDIARTPSGRAKIVDGSWKGLENIDPGQMMVVATGTQGEPEAAMSKAARGEHKRLSFEENDRVIFSASVIPGNEVPCQEVFDAIKRTGAELLTPADRPLLHASGHGGKVDNKRYIDAVRPTSLIAVHGGAHQLDHQTEWAKSLGLQTYSARNGDVLQINHDGIAKIGEQKHRFTGLNQVGNWWEGNIQYGWWAPERGSLKPEVSQEHDAAPATATAAPATPRGPGRRPGRRSAA